MYFTALGKKEISLDIPGISRQRLSEAIESNIENPKGFFNREPEKPFCGELKDGVFILGLNNYLDGKHTPFNDFSCVVSGDEKNSKLKITFQNNIYTAGYLFTLVLVGVFCAYYTDSCTAAFAGSGLMILIGTIIFNMKLNRCMEEIEYIIDKIIIDRLRLHTMATGAFK